MEDSKHYELSDDKLTDYNEDIYQEEPIGKSIDVSRIIDFNAEVLNVNGNENYEERMSKYLPEEANDWANNVNVVKRKIKKKVNYYKPSLLLKACNCKRKRIEQEERRKVIHTQFVEKTYKEKGSWIMHCMNAIAVKRRRSRKDSGIQRASSYNYNLPDESGVLIKVCQLFFLHTFLLLLFLFIRRSYYKHISIKDITRELRNNKNTTKH